MKKYINRIVSVSVVFFILIDSHYSMASNEHFAVEMKKWRRPGNDGVNSLYLQLRLLGYRYSYPEYLNVIDRYRPLLDFSSMESASADCGISLVTVRLTLKELQASQLPVICHVEHSLHNTKFVVWTGQLSKTISDAVLFEGGRSAIYRDDIDSFRREWSGFALVPVIRPVFFGKYYVMVFEVCGGFVAFYIGSKILYIRMNKDTA